MEERANEQWRRSDGLIHALLVEQGVDESPRVYLRAPPSRRNRKANPVVVRAHWARATITADCAQRKGFSTKGSLSVARSF